MNLTELKETLTANKHKINNLLGFYLNNHNAVIFDTSINNKELNKIDVTNVLEFSVYCKQFLKTYRAKCSIGGYLEKRNIYNHHNLFNNENRNIHLGIDIFSKEGCPIYTPLDGKVHSFKNNNNLGDYGPTVILEHTIEKITFYTLYGHLSILDLSTLQNDKFFKAGDLLGHLGTPNENGGWPPHLHFQLITDMLQYFGDFPGVCSEDELPFFSKICPNPNWILNSPLLNNT